MEVLREAGCGMRPGVCRILPERLVSATSLYTTPFTQKLRSLLLASLPHVSSCSSVSDDRRSVALVAQASSCFNLLPNRPAAVLTICGPTELRGYDSEPPHPQGHPRPLPGPDWKDCRCPRPLRLLTHSPVARRVLSTSGRLSSMAPTWSAVCRRRRLARPISGSQYSAL